MFQISYGMEDVHAHGNLEYMDAKYKLEFTYISKSLMKKQILISILGMQ